MIQNSKMVMVALTLLAVPVFVCGCGGGSSSSFGTTPTATPAPTPLFRLDAKFSQVLGGATLPPNRIYPLGQGSVGQFTTTRFPGETFNTLQIRFGETPTTFLSENSISIISKDPIKTGSVFTLNGNLGTTEDRNVSLSVPGRGLLRSTTGNLKIISLVDHPAVGTKQATATVKFILSDVVIGSRFDRNSFQLDATGQATVENYGLEKYNQ